MKKHYNNIYDCWDHKGFPVHSEAFTETQARQQCERLHAVHNVEWHGAPSKTNTFITKASCLGSVCSDSNPHLVRSAYLPGCENNTTHQSEACLASQQRWESKKRKGCVAPTVTQFAPSYGAQSDLLKAPICVGTATWNYDKGDTHSSGLTYVACFAKDQCEQCPCKEPDAPCYDPRSGECRRATGRDRRSCPAGTLAADGCEGGKRSQQDCARYGTKLLCPSAEECTSGEYALDPQQVLRTQ